MSLNNTITAKKVVFSIGHYMIAIAIILNFRSMWTTIDEFSRFSILFYRFGLILGILACIACNPSGIKIKRLTISLGYSLILLLYLGLFLMINNDNSYAYLNFIVSVFFIALYVGNCCALDGGNKILETISNIVYCLALLSLMFWLLGSILNIIKPTGYYLSNWTGQENVYKRVTSYFLIHFETQRYTLASLELLFSRNTGIFTEAPMAAFVYVIAILYQLFIAERTKIHRIIILFIAIISTGATTGIVASLIAYVLKKIFETKGKGFWAAIKTIMLPLIILLAIILVYNIVEIKLSTASGSTRLDDLYAGINAWKNDLFFGNGFLNDSVLASYMSSWRYMNQGYSNSVFYVLSQGGIYLGITFLIPFLFGITRAIKKKQWNKMSFIIVYFILFSITISPYQYFTILILLLIISNNGMIGIQNRNWAPQNISDIRYLKYHRGL